MDYAVLNKERVDFLQIQERLASKAPVRDRIRFLRVLKTGQAQSQSAPNPAWSNVSSPIRNSDNAIEGPGHYSAKLLPANPLGPWKTIKVNKGDQITVQAKAYYTFIQYPQNNAVNLVTYVSGLSPTQPSESGNVPRLLGLGLMINPSELNSSSAIIPKAYLEFILQTGETGKELVTKANRLYITSVAKTGWETLTMTYTAETSGYFQILVANESDQAVWFDEISMNVVPASVYQETHYDPWGLELAGIEGRGNPEHDYKFQGKELIDDLSLYWQDFGARYYDPQLGRWHVGDPANQFGSPYIGMGNNPVIGTDPDGRWVHIAIGAAIGGIVNLGIKAYQGKIKSPKDGFVAFGIGAVAGGVTAATGGAVAGSVGLSMSTAAGGAVAGAAGAVYGAPIQGLGNSAYFGDPYGPKQYLTDIVIGGVVGGVSGAVANWINKARATKAPTAGDVDWDDAGKALDEVVDGTGGLGEGAQADFNVTYQGETTTGGVHEIPAGPLQLGTFDIPSWNGYPTIGNVPQPTGPFRLIVGAEYDAARALANRTNELLKQQGVFPRGVDVHEIHPVKFGGSPTDLANKIALPRATHSQYTTWWTRLQRSLESNP